MSKECLAVDSDIFKCVVGEACLEHCWRLSDSKPVRLAASLHQKEREIKNKVIRKAARALGLSVQNIAPVDNRLEPTLDPRASVVTIQTHYGIGRYLYTPRLEHTFSNS